MCDKPSQSDVQPLVSLCALTRLKLCNYQPMINLLHDALSNYSVRNSDTFTGNYPTYTHTHTSSEIVAYLSTIHSLLHSCANHRRSSRLRDEGNGCERIVAVGYTRTANTHTNSHSHSPTHCVCVLVAACVCLCTITPPVARCSRCDGLE